MLTMSQNIRKGIYCRLGGWTEALHCSAVQFTAVQSDLCTAQCRIPYQELASRNFHMEEIQFHDLKQISWNYY